MIEDVARALCEAAGKSHNGAGASCQQCDINPDGTRACNMWDTFQEEAKAAIRAAQGWHKRERRWPSWVQNYRS